MKKKLQIMKTKPEITDAEIRSHMDFDRLLTMHQQNPGNSYGSIAKTIGIVSAILLVGLVGVMIFRSASNENLRTEKNLKPLVPSIADSTERSPSTVSKAQEEGDSSTVKQLSAQQRLPEKAVRKNTPEQKAVEQEVVTTLRDAPQAQQPVQPVYVQAQPVAGYPDLYNYFSMELQYPKEAMKDSIRGEVIAVFTINVQGLPEKISIEQSLGPVFDQEVIRLITNMPPWKPATYNSNPVASKMSLPLTFQIKKIKSEK